MPDLNSVPPSPHVLAASRQPSSTSVAGTASTSAMPPPPVPASPSSIHVFPSNQMAVAQGGAVHSSALPAPFFLPPLSPAGASGSGSGPQGDGPGVGPGPGPLRHPRPLTTAELHMQLEKEQEAVVNRLTRELTLLRAQNASVVSNASSTSASGLSDAVAGTAGPSSLPSVPGPGNDALFSGTSGFSMPSSTGRHNRTYSNTSVRSQTAAAGSTPSVVGITAPAPIRPVAPNLSRQNSTASRRSRANSPGPSSSVSHAYAHPPHLGEAAAAGNAQNQLPPHSARAGAAPLASEMSPALLPGTARYDDAAFLRAELESIKRENEALRRRVRELERAAAATGPSSHQHPPAGAASSPHHHGHHHHHHPSSSSAQRERRERRSSDISRGRSESVSTTASMSVQTAGSVPAAAASSSSAASLSALTASAGASLATAASSSPSAIAATPASGGGVGIAGRRESVRERVTSMLSVAGSAAGSVGVGVPEDEVRVGESAASAGLRGDNSGDSRGAGNNNGTH